MAVATFTSLTARLAAAKADLAIRAANIATAATAVASVSAAAVGQETDAERVARLNTMLDITLGNFASAASVAQGETDNYRRAIAHDLFEIKGTV